MKRQNEVEVNAAFSFFLFLLGALKHALYQHAEYNEVFDSKELDIVEKLSTPEFHFFSISLPIKSLSTTVLKLQLQHFIMSCAFMPAIIF